MNARNTKTILLAFFVAALIVSLSGANIVFGEFSEAGTQALDTTVTYIQSLIEKKSTPESVGQKMYDVMNKSIYWLVKDYDVEIAKMGNPLQPNIHQMNATTAATDDLIKKMEQYKQCGCIVPPL